jgi:hypothetical protein
LAHLVGLGEDPEGVTSAAELLLVAAAGHVARRALGGGRDVDGRRARAEALCRGGRAGRGQRSASRQEAIAAGKGEPGRTGRVLKAGLVEALRGAEVGADLLRHGRARSRGAIEEAAVLAVNQAGLGGRPAVGERLRSLVGGRGLENDEGLRTATDLGRVARTSYESQSSGSVAGSLRQSSQRRQLTHRALRRRRRDRDRVVAIALCGQGEQESSVGCSNGPKR